jgi:hypothetical protein
MQVADVVVTAGSTIGAEALFWGRPVVNIRETVYSSTCRSIPTVEDPDTLAMVLERWRSLEPIPHEALAFGYWCLTFGEPFRLFQPDGLGDGRFLGKRFTRHRRLYLLGSRGLARLRQMVRAGVGDRWHPLEI